MPRKRPRPVGPDEVTITRDPPYARIDYAGPEGGGMNLELGPEVAWMSDAEILDHHNAVADSMAALAAEWKDKVVEVPPGQPQITHHARADQWVPRGSLLRCEIGDDAETGRPRFYIDDVELDLEAFGRLMATYTGWGARIAFVPDDRTHVNPRVEVRDPGAADGDGPDT